MSNEGAWVCGIGMVTPVGGCTAQTAASVRAGISLYEESPVQNKKLEPMTMALVPEDILPPLSENLAGTPKISSRQIRMLRLAHLALPEALESLPEDFQQAVPLFLSGPEPIPGCPLPIDESFLDLLAIQTEHNFDQGQSGLFANGRAGGMQALQSALQALSMNEHDFVLVGGVDSYLDLFLLATLDEEDRILANGIMNGFAPGEAAGFLLLCSDSAREALRAKPSIKIYSSGIAAEPGHRYSEEAYTGEGLAIAVTAALESLNGEPVKTIFSSINGENYGAKEWGVAYIRNSSFIEPEFAFLHPAECFGDVGAAAMPILTGLATVGIKGGYIAGPTLSICSSDGPHRGAVCLSLEQ